MYAMPNTILSAPAKWFLDPLDRCGYDGGMTELAPKRAAFVREYLIDFNGTQAAIRAGYAVSGAKQEAARLLTNADVMTVLAARRTELAAPVLAEAQVTVERVLREYARIAFADMRRFATVSAGGVRLLDSKTWTDDDAAAVESVSETVTKEGGSVRFKLHDKVGALNQLAKYLGMVSDGTQVNIDARSVSITPERLRELRELLG